MNRARLITGSVHGRGRLLTHPVRPRSWGILSGIRVTASEDVRRNLYKPVRVTPDSPQTLQWLTPGNVLTYQIITNLDWHIE